MNKCLPRTERDKLGIATLIKKPQLYEVLDCSYNALWVLVSNKTTTVILVALQ